MEHISPKQCDYYAEACAVAFQKNNHTSETTVKLNGLQNGDYLFAWEKVTKLDGYSDNDIVAENAAYAIAFFFTDRVTEFTILSQSAKGTGIDYWLGYKKDHPKYDPYNFMVARLEVSGVFNGNDSDREQRVKKKERQILRSSELNLPGFISVTEFGQCKSTFVKR